MGVNYSHFSVRYHSNSMAASSFCVICSNLGSHFRGGALYDLAVFKIQAQEKVGSAQKS